MVPQRPLQRVSLHASQLCRFRANNVTATATEPSEGKEKKERKRWSSYLTGFGKSSHGEKADKEAKDAETPAVSSKAPQLDPVDPSASKPIEAETVTSPPEDTPKEDEPKEAAATDAPEEPATSPSSSKGLKSLLRELTHHVCGKCLA